MKTSPEDLIKAILCLSNTTSLKDYEDNRIHVIAYQLCQKHPQLKQLSLFNIHKYPHLYSEEIEQARLNLTYLGLLQWFPFQRLLSWEKYLDLFKEALNTTVNDETLNDILKDDHQLIERIMKNEN
jgi:hypothetical protein